MVSHHHISEMNERKYWFAYEKRSLWRYTVRMFVIYDIFCPLLNKYCPTAAKAGAKESQ